MYTYFISGHLDLTQEEFDLHYKSLIDAALLKGCGFVIGDASGGDTMAQKYLCDKTHNVVIYHMFTEPRNYVCKQFETKGGYKSDGERDREMTEHSDEDIAWIRPGKEKSGTARNLKRRQK